MHGEMNTIPGIRGEKANDILQKACDYYGIDKDDLCISRKGTQKYRWKKYLVIALYNHTDLSFVEIQGLLGYKSYNSMHYNYEVLRDQISGGVYASDKTKLSYNELIKYLGL
jgi:hypothetical protein